MVGSKPAAFCVWIFLCKHTSRLKSRINPLLLGTSPQIHSEYSNSLGFGKFQGTSPCPTKQEKGTSSTQTCLGGYVNFQQGNFCSFPVCFLLARDTQLHGFFSNVVCSCG